MMINSKVLQKITYLMFCRRHKSSNQTFHGLFFLGQIADILYISISNAGNLQNIQGSFEPRNDYNLF